MITELALCLKAFIQWVVFIYLFIGNSCSCRIQSGGGGGGWGVFISITIHHFKFTPVCIMSFDCNNKVYKRPTLVPVAAKPMLAIPASKCLTGRRNPLFTAIQFWPIPRGKSSPCSWRSLKDLPISKAIKYRRSESASPRKAVSYFGCRCGAVVLSKHPSSPQLQRRG